MTWSRAAQLLTFGVLGLCPGCLPLALEQRTRPDPAITVTDVQFQRDATPYHHRRTPVPTLPAEQEQPEYLPPLRPESPVPPLFPPPLQEPAQPTPPPDPALVAAVRAYLAGDLEGARRHLGTSRSETTLGTQEELLALLTRLQERDLDQISSEEAGVMLARVEQLVRTVQARAPLVLDAACFCRRIKAFGVYDPLPARADAPGKPPRVEFQAGAHGQHGELVCVYAEVRNVLSHKSGAWHVVALDGTLEILTYEGGRTVFRTDFPADPNRSRSPRLDCFVGYEFHIPPGLPPGDYVLRIQVRDLASRTPRLARKSLDFRVVEASLADGR